MNHISFMSAWYPSVSVCLWAYRHMLVVLIWIVTMKWTTTTKSDFRKYEITFWQQITTKSCLTINSEQQNTQIMNIRRLAKQITSYKILIRQTPYHHLNLALLLYLRFQYVLVTHIVHNFFYSQFSETLLPHKTIRFRNREVIPFKSWHYCSEFPNENAFKIIFNAPN